ncbi:MAG: succinate dehydrogenase, hydrophobic membrane anchor protein [Alphaproteobacteria bacterium]|nr:succinate dehydrogenase, hydrophobic membrane anchor protein [Alphaproteobacteria bacterium]
MSMRSELSKVRGLGSAKSGTEHFWQQRVTAIANVPLVIFVVWFVIAHLGAKRADVVASIQHPLTAIVLILAMASILWHMRLGLQIVIEDYVHAPALKLACLLANIFFATGLFAVSAYAILKMSFGL